MDGISIEDRLVRLEEVDSTNREARERGVAGAPGGTVIVARRQTAGRGRLGRKWASPEGGLWMSMIVRPPEGARAETPLLSIAAGVAAAGALGEVFGEAGLEPDRVKLGWPNDVLVEDRKIAGILCEVCSRPEPAFVIIGVGLNLNNRAADLPAEFAGMAISVSELCGSEYPVDGALEKMVALLDNKVSRTLEGEVAGIIEEWKERSALFGRNVIIQSPGSAPYEAVPHGIDGRGRLLVRDAGGSEKAVEFEETTLVR